MKEIWKPVKGYEGLYEVSNLGRVKSLDHIVDFVIYGVNASKKVKGRILKNHLAQNGYYIVCLHKGSSALCAYVHRLVAQAFLENPNNFRYINHKDETRINNIVYVNQDVSIDEEKSNLEWCTQKHNLNWGTARMRLSASKKGNPYNNRRIAQLSLDGTLLKVHNSAAEAAESIGAFYPPIIGCCRGYVGHKTYKGYKWRYADEK